ncbi:helix-turn-helix transcriptional regulator [Pseudonocardia alaniniphila]|uniref:LuxR C-terminal-related transcriptional regulator n=1 Tax=Pseudonocardia alaniniphila TaxID=75291 RepID=A0ABS9TQN8_9PSEU|nr:LuxR family transcriptional regulator [Pseudonocardia alaniniphila]MCH6170859.1 LuxR C-terminal-related transcriptional regulator [Pseudonocardia alaniniphila]
MLPPRLAAHAVLWVFTARHTDTSPMSRRTVDRLCGAGAEQLVLSALDDAAVVEVTQDMLAATPGEDVLDVVRRAHGQPFLLVELLRGLRDEGLMSCDNGVLSLKSSELPQRFRDSITGQLDRLSDPARDLVEMASVLGHGFSVEQLAELLQTPVPELVAPLREALQAELLVEAGSELRFRHDLIREAVGASLPTTLGHALRRRAVNAMLAHGAPPAEVAALVFMIARTGDLASADLLARASAELAHAAPADAARLADRALTLTPYGRPERPARIVSAMSLFVAAGAVQEARHLADTVLNGVVEPVDEARARLGLAWLSMQYSGPDVVEQTQRALTQPDLPTALRIELSALQSHGYAMSGDPRGGSAPAERALHESARFRDPDSRVAALTAATGDALVHGRWVDALRLSEEAVALRPFQRSARGVWVPDCWRSLLLMCLARIDEAIELSDAGLRESRCEGPAINVRVWMMCRARYLWAAGRLDEAQAEAEAVLEMTDDLGPGGYVTAIAHYLLGRIGLRTGDRLLLSRAAREARTMALEKSGLLRQHGRWLSALVTDAGSADSAGWPAVELAAEAFAPFGSDRPQLVSARQHDDVVAFARLAVAAGRPEAAESVVGRMTQHAADDPDFPYLAAAVRHSRALLEGDVPGMRDALALYEGTPYVLPQADAYADAARMVASTQPADAVEYLERALSAYSAAGAERDAARTRKSLGDLGVRRRRTSPPRQGWLGLTSSELKVVRLVAAGATNREAADELFLSPHTVSSHLRHAFTKLRIRSRVELARVVAEQDGANRAGSPGRSDASVL